jgi:hypothetical protein
MVLVYFLPLARNIIFLVLGAEASELERKKVK